MSASHRKSLSEDEIEERECKLKGLMLRKIVRENHHQPIKVILPNRTSMDEKSNTSIEDEYSSSVSSPIPTYSSSLTVTEQSSKTKKRGPKNSNLIATIGSNQASIYDNAHLGQHFDLIANYVNLEQRNTAAVGDEDGEDNEEQHQELEEGRKTKQNKSGNGSDPSNKQKRARGGVGEEEEEGQLNCGAWIGVGMNINDALLAVGGNDNDIKIISVLHSRVIGILKGHDAAIIDLQSCSFDDDDDSGRKKKVVVLVSISNDKTIRVWNMTEFCNSNIMPRGWMCDGIPWIAIPTPPLSSSPTVSAIHPEGKSIIVGDDKGSLFEYSISSFLATLSNFTKTTNSNGGREPKRLRIEDENNASNDEGDNTAMWRPLMNRNFARHKHSISCISFANSEKHKKLVVISMSNDDKVFGHDYQSGENLFQLNISTLSVKGRTKLKRMEMEERDSSEVSLNRRDKSRPSTKNCKFGISDDGRFISTGDDKGRICIFDIDNLLSDEKNSSTCFTKLEHKRANRIADPRIRATCFGYGCDNLLGTSAEYIWRWEYTTPPPLPTDVIIEAKLGDE